MGVAYSTLRVWKDKYLALSAALKRGKEVVDRQVENALFKNAIGYSYEEVTREMVDVYDPTTGQVIGHEMQVTKVVKKDMKPDTTAQIFWLKNRKSSVWRDKQDVQVEGSLNTTSSLTDEELEDRISRLRSKLGISDD
jgi:hypothetical protein